MTNIVDVIRRENAGRLDRLAVVAGDRTYTYAQLLAATDRARDELRGLGVQPYDRIALHAGDDPDYIIASLAILAAGAVIVPVAPTLSADELADVLERIDVRGLLVNLPDRCLPADWPLATCGHDRPMMWRPRQVREAEPHPDYRAKNPAFVRFSSGTTGSSKGVLLAHDSIVARTDAADRMLDMTADDEVLWVLSMSYHFVVSILLFLRRGCRIILCNRDFPNVIVDHLQRGEGTFIYASPFHYHALATSTELADHALARVRLAISTAMRLPEETAAEFHARFGFELAEAYGIIEVGLPLINRHPGEATRGSVGTVVPGFQVEVRDPDANGTGRIFVRGPGMFDCYYCPWTDAADVFADGWFATGDMGRFGDHGALYIVGREKNVINFAGMKIFPYEVEEVLERHPDVHEALVVGRPHPQFGEVPHALVVPAPGRTPDATELRHYCLRHLASFEVPKTFAWVDRLERTASGKKRRH